MADAHTADVLVVGSGLAGLTTALRFLNASRACPTTGKRPKVVILESSDVLGGRTRSTRLQQLPDNAPLVSYGGTWVVLDNDDLIALSQEVEWLPFQPKLLPNYSKDALNLGFIFAPYLVLKLWLLGKQIVSAAVELPPALIELDSVPLSTWVEQNKDLAAAPDRAAQAVIDWFFQVENYPSDISTLSTFFAAKSVFVRLSNITQTGLIVPKIMRWQDGTGEITHRMLAKIQTFGGDIVFHRRVTSVQQDENGVTITASALDQPEGSTEVWKASHVVVAAALTNASALEYQPPLPANLTSFMPALRTWDDPSLQVVLAFKTQWWNDEHQGTNIYPPPVPDSQKGVYGPVFDLSEAGPKAHGKKSKNGIIRIICKTSRCTHEDGTRWSDEEIQASAIDYLARFHKKGHETHENTVARIEKQLVLRWFFDFQSTPDINAVTFFFAPSEGQLYARNMRYLSESFGRVFFAGSERALRGFNWMEGAALTGRQIALKVLHAYYGSNWSDADDKAYIDQIREWKEEGLRAMHRQDIWDIPKYIHSLVQITLDTIRHIFGHLFHHEAQPTLVCAMVDDHEAPFRAPENDSERALLAELTAAAKDLPDLDRL